MGQDPPECVLVFVVLGPLPRLRVAKTLMRESPSLLFPIALVLHPQSPEAEAGMWGSPGEGVQPGALCCSYWRPMSLLGTRRLPTPCRKGSEMQPGPSHSVLCF